MKKNPHYLAGYDPAEYDFDDHDCIVTKAMFDRLDTYNSTRPTGPQPGRVWKCNSNDSPGRWGRPAYWQVIVVDVHPFQPDMLVWYARDLFVADEITAVNI